jgi:hypothetical protein
MKKKLEKQEAFFVLLFSLLSSSVFANSSVESKKEEHHELQKQESEQKQHKDAEFKVEKEVATKESHTEKKAVPIALGGIPEVGKISASQLQSEFPSGIQCARMTKELPGQGSSESISAEQGGGQANSAKLN